jgi:hypothetical protein
MERITTNIGNAIIAICSGIIVRTRRVMNTASLDETLPQKSYDHMLASTPGQQKLLNRFRARALERELNQ